MERMFVETPGEADADGEAAAYLRKERDFWGYLPNYAACFSTRPDVAQAWQELTGAVRAGMERRRYELATIAAARARRSTYCTMAHSAFLRDVCGDEATATALAHDPAGSTADLADADRAVVAFATRLAQDAASIEQADVDALRAAGLSDADVVDVVMAVAARMFFTTVLDGLGAQVDPPLAGTFPPDVRDALVVGRDVAPA